LSAHDAGVTARLRRGGRIEEVPAGWVLGCDGTHSKVREELGVLIEGATYPERVVLAELAIDGTFDHEKARVWLPAGRAVNMGVEDAFNLSWKLALVLGNGAPPALLDSYEAERRPIDEAVVRQTDRGTRLISLHGAVARFVRDHLLSPASRLPPVADRFGEAIAGLAGNYRDSSIVEDHAATAVSPHAGERAPDVALDAGESGAPTSLYRLVAQHRRLLLLVGAAGAPPPLPQEIARYPIAVGRCAAAGDSGRPHRRCGGALWFGSPRLPDPPRRLCHVSLRLGRVGGPIAALSGAGACAGLTRRQSAGTSPYHLSLSKMNIKILS
jgi:FAD binding domain